MNKEQLFFCPLFFLLFSFSLDKGCGFTALIASHPQGILDTVPSVAEGDRQFSVRAGGGKS